LKNNRIMPFCNLFIGRPSYNGRGIHFDGVAFRFSF